MARMRVLSLTALAATVLFAVAPFALGQTPSFRLVHAPGEVRSYALDYATGELTEIESDDPGADAFAPACFSNANFTGFYAPTTLGIEWIDWGVKSCGLTGAICELVFGYGTTALETSAGGPGAALDITMYSGTLGTCDSKTELATYSFTGLPGSPDGVAWATANITVNIEIKSFLATDGPIGWGYVGTDDVTGPLLITTPDPAVGTVDTIDVYTAPASVRTCLGTFDLPLPGVASFWMQLGEDDGSGGGGTATLRVTSSGSCTGAFLVPAGPPPVIGGTWSPVATAVIPWVAGTEFLGLGTQPLDTGCLGFGPLLISVTPPNPIIIPVPGGGVGGPLAVPIPVSCALIGASVSAQYGGVSLLGALQLTDSAVDFTIGV